MQVVFASVGPKKVLTVSKVDDNGAVKQGKAPLKVDDYQLFSVEPIEARYIRITFIKGHLREGQTDWNYSEAGNVSVGDLQVFIYNR